MALASLAAFAAMVLLVLGSLEAALMVGLASVLGPVLAQASLSENPPP